MGFRPQGNTRPSFSTSSTAKTSHLNLVLQGMQRDVQRPRVVVARQYVSFAEYSGPGLIAQNVMYRVQNSTAQTYMCLLGRRAPIRRPIRPRKIDENLSGSNYVHSLNGAQTVAPHGQVWLEAFVTLELTMKPDAAAETVKAEDFTALPTIRDYRLHIACFEQDNSGLKMPSLDLPVFLRVEFPAGNSPQQYTLRVQTSHNDFTIAV
jgi:hypothetical protein